MNVGIEFFVYMDVCMGVYTRYFRKYLTTDKQSDNNGLCFLYLQKHKPKTKNQSGSWLNFRCGIDDNQDGQDNDFQNQT